MKLDDFTSTFPRLPGAMPVWHGSVSAEDLRALCEQVLHGGGKLVALWGSDETQANAHYALHVALVAAPGMLVLSLPIDHEKPAFPDLSDLFPAANRMQRSVTDMLGLHPVGASDQRKWLRHAAWPGKLYPLRKAFDSAGSFPLEEDGYAFVPVTGNGVHEIAVGPVHAGTIEPGHFRFSVVGERVLRLEERLGYKHKGIEKRFEDMTLQQGAKLAGRISGDSTVAYAWAYAQAVESVTGCTPPRRALWLRALLLELERMHNHLGDLGYLGNDAALVFGFAQFWILKEDLLRMNGEVFGHRYLMDRIIPGGVACDLDEAGLARITATLNHIEHEIAILKDIYDEHAGVQDRFLTTGRVMPELAARLGLTGMAGRASGQAWDARAQFPCVPYDQLDVRMATHRNGDVAARVIVRFEEIAESMRLIRLMLERMPVGDDLIAPLADAQEGVLGIGWVEGWRGEILVALHTGKNNSIQRLHAHDPSWQNWPVLEHAIMDNIVPDFPLINKSFNLSYSGVDL
ncbi:MAG: NADH-quinone oxidoreductase subunit C [Nitrosomonadales bacterium]|nr:NADH-quinone oxidoreductase subunit C [Nitrosomonadales bacterium]